MERKQRTRRFQADANSDRQIAVEIYAVFRVRDFISHYMAVLFSDKKHFHLMQANNKCNCTRNCGVIWFSIKTI